MAIQRQGRHFADILYHFDAEGDIVDKFTEENIGRQDLADYLNVEPVNFDHLKT